VGIIVRYVGRPDIAPLSMSNGLTAVFFSVMAIAASMQATTDRQRLLAVWIASHDQGIYGRGTVDTDLEEIPWSIETLEEDRDFLRRVATAALEKLGWARLNYEPKEEMVFACLRQFRSMLDAFSPEHLIAANAPEWRFGEAPSSFQQCQRHGVYLHTEGCILCNDD